MEKLTITAALIGTVTMHTQPPYLPLNNEEMANQAIQAADGGSASVYIHARNSRDGGPTLDKKTFR